ncbi:hypothetical protein [Streptomyces sp. NPDC055681]
MTKRHVLLTAIASVAGSHSWARAATSPHPPPRTVDLDLLGRLASRIKAGTTLLPCIANASPPEVARFAASPDPAVRILVAARRDLPSDIRDALATDRDAKVLKNIASHPGLTDARLRARVERHRERVATQVAANPSTSPGLLEELTRQLPAGRKALRVIARHPAAPGGHWKSAATTSKPALWLPGTRTCPYRQSSGFSPTTTGRLWRLRLPTHRCRRGR